jgi:hypothetical protein
MAARPASMPARLGTRYRRPARADIPDTRQGEGRQDRQAP